MNEKTKLPALINSLADLSNMGKVFAQSGMFKDAMDASKAIVKIMAGRELGIAPVLSMTKIHVVKGKITIGAEIMAGLISGSGTHKYKITQHTNTQCDIEFYEKDNHGKLELLGVSSFGAEDAKRITHWDSKLGKKKSLFEGDNYQNYPQNMYFSRAMSNGCRWFVPHLIHGGYTPEEMGAEVIINEQGEQEVV
ncbi:MAG: hypothetical protein H8E13_04115, partial [Actinobacteria bacterium]|nr:hypothetical protein [Actinomycetota bacterium]